MHCLAKHGQRLTSFWAGGGDHCMLEQGQEVPPLNPLTTCDSLAKPRLSVPYCLQGNWGSEGLSDLCKVTQMLRSGTARIRGQTGVS